MNNKKQKFQYFILEWLNFWKYKDFQLGVCFTIQNSEMLGEGATYDMLNHDIEIPTIKLKEYLFLISMGFWQINIGIRFRRR